MGCVLYRMPNRCWLFVIRLKLARPKSTWRLGTCLREMAVRSAFCQCGPRSYIGTLQLMHRFLLSPQGIPNRT